LCCLFCKKLHYFSKLVSSSSFCYFFL
jgi:hypothetical protein